MWNYFVPLTNYFIRLANDNGFVSPPNDIVSIRKYPEDSASASGVPLDKLDEIWTICRNSEPFPGIPVLYPDKSMKESDI
jgi:hypothetical protein